ncbi:hypothetical protein IFM89_033710 [Coptis chinensis]|uniref:GDPGP1-like N-terminal domain-containing protein n=1 Tax=Coptis chinensis TaxID=261450 RepID=A0A835LF93_9MAGN|nr:hypothetical protein IFM89_033710 [Coptis chinensis]
MLSIKRVPTVVSNYQKDTEEAPITGCGHNCFLNCCVQDPSWAFFVGMRNDLGVSRDKNVDHAIVLKLLCILAAVIPGEYGFIAQLNEGHHLKKRPTEVSVDKFEESDTDETQFFPSALIDTEDSPNVVAINVSPIEYGHVLLIPKILERFSQRIDRQSFLLALNMAAEAGNPYF